MDINSTEHKSNVSFGSNFITRKYIQAKKNQAFGQQLADFSAVVIPIGITFDEELIDAPVIKLNRNI